MAGLWKKLIRCRSPQRAAGDSDKRTAPADQSPPRDAPPDDDQPWIPPETIDLPVSDTLDLHTFRPSELGGLLPDWLAEARAAGFTSVRIIHGKGKGVLRRSVHAVLGRLEMVEEFGLAPENTGATVVRLKKD